MVIGQIMMFLFLMGLELDVNLVVKRARVSLVVSMAGIAAPFILSIGVSYYYWTYIEGVANLTSFPKFILFIGVAMSITAFPVLARILTECNLLHTPVGVSVLSAAACDDAMSWIFLALTVALAAASTPLIGLYVLLTAIAFVGFMIIVVRPLIARLHNHLNSISSTSKGSKSSSNSNNNKDSSQTTTHNNIDHQHDSSSSSSTHVHPFMLFVAFALAMASSLMTSMIGIHTIFGAFVTGLIMPRKNSFNVHLTERLEEFISTILLPLFFTFSGLRTNIGTINSLYALGGCVLVISACIFGKLGGCAGACLAFGLPLRESLAVGTLMNAKGLVELIVLNIGLDAKLINPPIFAIMVVMAIVTTCMTTPLISIVYPESYYLPQEPLQKDESPDSLTPTTAPSAQVESTPLSAFRMLASLRGAKLVPHSIGAEVKDYGTEVLKVAYAKGVDTVFVPLTLDSSTTTGLEAVSEPGETSNNVLVGGAGVKESVMLDLAYQLVRKSRINVGILIDHSNSTTEVSESLHILIPFFGGPDDRAALGVGLRLASVPGSTVTILHIRKLSQTGEGNGQVVVEGGGVDLGSKSGRRKSIFEGIKNGRRSTSAEGSGENKKVSEATITLASVAGGSKHVVLPAGFKVDEMDVEDERLLKAVMGNVGLLMTPNAAELRNSGSVATLTVETNPTAPTVSNIPTVPEVDDIAEAPLTSDHLGVPFHKVPTSTSITSVTAIPSPTSSSLPTSASKPPTTSTAKPTIHLTEVASVDPLETLLQSLRGNVPKFQMIVMGHYGPTFSSSSTVLSPTTSANNEEGNAGTFTSRHQWTMNGATFQREGISGTRGLKNLETVMGPTASAMVKSGVVGGVGSRLLVVRKLRVDWKRD
ncbi:hypothetical protein HDV05_004338 [Chytridiales sp. JEL 0842]|nr:hypothetical protein HDV05_004338 [Chytridiales sp. JEL 0842]